VRITLCVPVPNNGQELFKLFVESASRLASGKHEIEVEFTCHNESQRLLTQTNGLKLRVRHSHLIEREEPRYWHANSVTHSRCVNALFASVDADVAVICDFDMALVYKNWDELLVESILERDVAFFGTPYSADAALQFNLPQCSVLARKYQGKPNCMFIGFSPRRLKSITNQLCDFASTYGDPNSIPLSFISNPVESRYFGLPVGSFLQVDTGSRIPLLIEQHALTCHLLERSVKNYMVLKSARFPDNYPPLLYPEEYLQGGVPFVVHFRKGGSKLVDNSYGPAFFKKDVNTWIDAIAP
jgi:hypothetical protein